MMNLKRDEEIDADAEGREREEDEKKMVRMEMEARKRNDDRLSNKIANMFIHKGLH